MSVLSVCARWYAIRRAGVQADYAHYETRRAIGARSGAMGAVAGQLVGVAPLPLGRIAPSAATPDAGKGCVTAWLSGPQGWGSLGIEVEDPAGPREGVVAVFVAGCDRRSVFFCSAVVPQAEH